MFWRMAKAVLILPGTALVYVPLLIHWLSGGWPFGAPAGGARLVDDAVSTSGAVDDAIRSAQTRWQRIKWRLSLRSLRPSTRSPVDV